MCYIHHLCYFVSKNLKDYRQFRGLIKTSAYAILKVRKGRQHFKMPGLDFCYEIIIMFSRTHTVFVCEKIIYLNNSVYVWQNYLFKIETWIIRARKMDLSFVVIDRQIVDRRVDLCFIRVHLTVSSFQSSFSSHTIPPSGPGTSLSVHSCPGIFFYNFRALENSHFVKADPGTSFFQFFRALEPPTPRIQGPRTSFYVLLPCFCCINPQSPL